MHSQTLIQLANGLKTKQFSSRELTQHYLDRIAAHDPQLNSFVTVTAQQALAQADAADAQIAAGQGGLLTGIKIEKKDMYQV